MKAAPAIRCSRLVSRVTRYGLAALALGLAWLATGCAAHTVRPYQRERLTDRIMSFEAEARRDSRMTKSLEAREGSTGGNGGAGGGCACN